jgi:hypothetical protein
MKVTTQIQAPSAESQLVLSLEQFVIKADAFLQNYYSGGNDTKDIQKILQAITNLQLDIDLAALKREFNY